MRHPESRSTKEKLKELDLPGTLLFFPAMTSLFMALTWAGTKLPWISPVIIALFCVFVVLLGVFTVEQWLKQDSATLPPRLFRNRSVLAGALFSFSCNGAVNVFEFYLSTWLQAVQGFGPAKSGYLMIPLIVSFLLSLLLQGSGVNVVGYYVPFMWATSILLPIASGLMTTFTVSTNLGKFLSCSAFLGFATGIGFQAPQVAVQNTLPEKDTHMGLAIILFAQHFGPALSIAATQTILTNRLTVNIERFAPEVDAVQIEKSGLGDLKSHIAEASLNNVLQALNESFTQSWYLPVALACATVIGSACMKWTNVKEKRR
jgi:MFS family permease